MFELRQKRVLSFFLVMLCSCCIAFGQAGQGSLAGNVYDQSGALVPHASIVATNEATGAVYSTISTAEGVYSLPSMGLGRYTVVITASGFSQSKQTGVVITVGTTTSLNIKLAAGTVNQTVVVNSNILTLDTQTSDVSGVVTSNELLNLPLTFGSEDNTRPPEAFTYLFPGTVAYGTGLGNGVPPGEGSKISGSQEFGSEVLLDGTDTLRSDWGSEFDPTAPSVDAIQEFRVELSTLPAEYTRTSGGIEIFASKSGTNHYHGALYDFFQNDDLNANTWYNNLLLSESPHNPAFARPSDKKNDYGVFLGGPVYIPRVYNGHNRTFFFFSWEQFNQHNSATNVSSVPNDVERQGDFSATLNTSNALGTNPCDGTPIYQGEIFDPSTTRVVAGVQCRTAFGSGTNPTNQVPISSTVAQNVLKLLPTPNLPGVVNNYALRTTGQNLSTMDTIRIDENIGQKDKAFFSLNDRENVPAINQVFPLPIDTTTPQDFTTHYFRVGWDRTFTPNAVNSLYIGVNRVNSQNGSLEAESGTTDWPAQIGISNIQKTTEFPIFDFNASDNVSGFGQNAYYDTIDNGWRLDDSFNWTHGRHTVKVGGQYYYQIYEPQSHNGQSGTFSFSRNETAGDSAETVNSGNSFASFLMGDVDGASLSVVGEQPKFLSHFWALYAEDEWRVNSQLVLNLGVNYSVDVPRREAHDDTSNISLTAPNPDAGNLPGALVFAGVGTGRLGQTGVTWADTWHKDIAPRVGFSWAPNFWEQHTDLRGGYGIYYAPLQYGWYTDASQDGFTVNPFAVGNGFLPAFQIDGGFPSYTLPPNLSAGQDNFGDPLYIAPSYGRPGMIQNWSLQAEQRIPGDFVLSVGYVGQRAVHLHTGVDNIDLMSKKYFSLGDALQTPVGSQASVPAPYNGFPGTYDVAQALLPYPQYGGFDTGEGLQNLGGSDFDALESTLQRRFQSGLTLLVSYTFSKTLTDAETALPWFAGFIQNTPGVQDPTNMRAEKSISQQDLPQEFVASYLYDLPVGKGKKFLGNTGPITSRAVSGWQIGGVQRYESGQPAEFANATGIPGWDAGIRYNEVPGQPIFSSQYRSGHFNPLSDRVYNTLAFSDPNSEANRAPRGGTWAFGDTPRVFGNVRMPLWLDEDFSLNKRTPITENKTLTFQMDMTNAFNRHVFAQPDNNPFGGTYDPSTQSFGMITNSLLGPRIVQFQLRLEY